MCGYDTVLAKPHISKQKRIRHMPLVYDIKQQENKMQQFQVLQLKITEQIAYRTVITQIITTYSKQRQETELSLIGRT